MVQILPKSNKFGGLAALLEGLIQGQDKLAQRKRQQADVSSVAQFLGNPEAARQLPQGQQGPVRGIPQVSSPFAQQALLQGIGQQQTRDASLAQAIELQKLKGPQTTSSSNVIIDPDDPDRAIRVQDTIDKSGKLLNRRVIGEATKAEAIGGVAAESLIDIQKPVAVEIQKEMKDATVDIANLESVRDQFKDEFTELPFKALQGITKLQEKAGGFLGEPSEENKQSLSDFSTWRRNASREFVVFKKWATGVAAGQQEMAQQIETAFASPRTDSATEFKSKIESSIKVRKRTLEILNGLLAGGSFGSKQERKEAESESLRQALLENQEGLLDGKPRSETVNQQSQITLETVTAEQLQNMTAEQLDELERQAGGI